MAVGEVLASPSSGFNRYDDRDSNITYVNFSNQSTNSNSHNSTYTGIATNTEIKFNFSGTSIKLLGFTLNSGVSFNVFIDSETSGKVYSCPISTNFKVVVFEIDGLTDTEHSIIFKNFSQTFRVDAVDILTGQALKPYKLVYLNKFLISSENKYYSVIPDIPTVYSADVVDKMTNFAAPTGYVVSTDSDLNNGNYIAWKAFDDSESYGWLTKGGVLTGYLRVQVPIAKTIKAYRISSADNILLSNASEWSFEGSNDGISWTTLDTVKDKPFTIKGDSRMYYINNNNSYSYYQFNCTKNSGYSTQIGLGEVELFEEISPYVYQTLVFVKDEGEQSFIKAGMNKESAVDINRVIGNLSYSGNQNTTLGSGKLFKQKIDRSKHPANKIILS
ncbi:hypothetical protein [Paenibacillus sp. FSL K6-1318]|uniref:hypothetical protein n=1 Tax=Paenibacillus sp. FSL K6-1318 TaxID=2975291 RepID=UPI0030ED774A